MSERVSRLLSHEDISKTLTMRDVLERIELVFRHHDAGSVVMPPKSNMNLRGVGIEGDTSIMPAYIGPLDASGVKLVSSHVHNSEQGLPNTLSTIVLQDPATGYPLAVMDGSLITGMRTGAVVALSAKYYARDDMHVAAFIGAGVQARFALRAICELFEISEVRVFDIAPEAAYSFAGLNDDGIRPKITVCSSVKEAVLGAQFVVTATTANEPLVLGEWLSPGSTAVAIGSFQEFDDSAVLQADKIVVDSWAQCSVRGELKRFVETGQIAKEDIYTEISSTVAGHTPGRVRESERIFVVPMGIGSHDIALARLVYDRITRSDTAASFRFF